MADDFTYNLDFGTPNSPQITVTPIDMAPDKLIRKTFKDGANLITFGDASHREFRIRGMFNTLLGDDDSKPTHYFSEIPDRMQSIYDKFKDAKKPEDEKPMRDLMIRDTDPYAPSITNPDLHKAYFDTRMGTYETARSKDIKVKFVDKIDQAEQDRMMVSADSGGYFEVNSPILTAFYDKNGKSRDIRTIPDAEVERIVNALPANVRAGNFLVITAQDKDGSVTVTPQRLLPDGGQGWKAKKESLQLMALQTLQTLDLKPTDHVDAVKAKSQDIITQHQLKHQQLVRSLTAKRDLGMATSIGDTYKNDKTTKGAFFVGLGHLDSRWDSRPEPSVVDHLKKNTDVKMARVDIISVSEEMIAKMGKTQKFAGMDCCVCVGGLPDVDYTIFVPGKIEHWVLKEKGKQPAAEGPHKDKLKGLKIGALLDDPELKLKGFAWAGAETGEHTPLSTPAVAKNPFSKDVKPFTIT